MTGKTKTALVLASYFVIAEALMMGAAYTQQQGWGVAISVGAVIGLFCILAYRKKTWARHLILVFMGFGTYFHFTATFNNPSLPVYILLFVYAFLFWALCWHGPILDFLGIPHHNKGNKS